MYYIGTRGRSPDEIEETNSLISNVPLLYKLHTYWIGTNEDFGF